MYSIVISFEALAPEIVKCEITKVSLVSYFWDLHMHTYLAADMYIFECTPYIVSLPTCIVKLHTCKFIEPFYFYAFFSRLILCILYMHAFANLL